MKMKLEEYLTDLKALIDKELDRCLPSQKESPRIIHNAMRYSVFSGGKRIRPILAIESCKVCGGDPGDVIRAACAIELVHTYSLIHDDLPSMDDDNYRRGKPTCHMVFGEANAILAGDALLTFAFDVISSNFDSERGIKIIRQLCDSIGTNGMLGGQAIDLEFKNRHKTKAESERINRLKTSRLFEAATKIGAIAASSGKKEIEAMAKFGQDLGSAFQIIDDIMDEESHIKPPGVRSQFQRCRRLTNRAKKYLKIFGHRAANLEKMADYILNRKS